MNDGEITRFLHSRYGYLLMALMVVASAVFASLSGYVAPLSADSGLLGLPAASGWLSGHTSRLVCGLLLALATSAVMVLVNSYYNIIHGLSMLYAGLFLVFTAAVPALTDNLSGGSFMAFAWVLTLIPLFSSYQSYLATRRVFITFCTATAAITVFMPAAALVYIAVYLAGCMQMRCMNLKCMLAAVIGIITPLWILFGFGIVTPDSVDFGALLSPLRFSPLSPGVYATAIVTIVAGGIMGIFNLIRIYSYNGRSRAFNGFITLTAVVTVALILVDSANTLSYLPLLNVCAAMQAGHFFTINNRRRTYVPVLCLMAVYVALYILNLDL